MNEILNERGGVMGAPYLCQRAGVTSTCCCAPIMDDSDVCLGCHDHCDGEKECDECEGDGMIKGVKCKKCDGEGFVKVDLC